MKSTQALRSFWHRLQGAESAALLLDYDGTLAPFAVVRNQALPYTGIPELLQDISSDTCTRLVIITGRAVADLLPLLKLQPPPEVWGCHGWERLAAGEEQVQFGISEQARAGLDEAVRRLRESGLSTSCEFKPASVAVHWRGLDDRRIAEMSHKVRELWGPLTGEFDLELHDFDGGLELRPPGKNKGTAVLTILQELDTATPVAFLGDDLTDEDGFAAIADRGLGILVNEKPRETRAQLRIVPPQDLIDFLSTWRDKAPPRDDTGEVHA